MPMAPPKHQRPAIGKRHGQRTPVERQASRALHTGSKAWRILRRRILVRDRYTCADCGLFGDQVDHINGDSHDNSESNLACRCASCHSAKTARETLHRNQ